VTVPLPLPLAPEVMVIQPTLLTAVQLQPASAATLTVAVPPAAGISLFTGLIEKAQAPA
jgi:hypothetical protein